MKTHALKVFAFILTFVVSYAEAQSQKGAKGDFFDTMVNNHNRIFPGASIPSAVEMVLKYHKVIDFDDYELQKQWQNKSDGSFRDFNNKEFHGITFSMKFDVPRNSSFPVDSLFQTIENELKAGRKVVIAIPEDRSWGIFVVHKQSPDGDFISYAKYATDTVIQRHVKERIRRSYGTEIMTYSLSGDL